MSTLDRTQAPSPGAVRPYAFPDVERSTLPNGLALFTARHGSVPIVNARIVLDAGATREPGEQAGVAHLVAHTIDTGTSTRDARQLSWELELLGAQLTVYTSFDATSISITVPSDRLEAALALLSEIVLDARFPEAEVERVRNEQLGEIAQRRSDPRSLASDEIVRFIYGPDATYGRPVPGTVETVERLTAQDARTFFGERYSARVSALVLVGAVDQSAAQIAAARFGGWQVEPGATRAASPASTPAGPIIHIVHRPGSAQSEIRLGHPGPTRSDPDYFALQVMNSILDGAFTSRLNMNLREKHGFTYGVRSSFNYRKGPGPFLISTAVASDVSARALQEILREVDGMRQEGPTDEEIHNTRQYLAGLLPLELQTTQQLSGRLAELFIHGLPDDYFQMYRARIAAVTRDDALRVAQDHIQPNLLTCVVVGDAAQIESPLRELAIGPVEVHSAHD